MILTNFSSITKPDPGRNQVALYPLIGNVNYFSQSKVMAKTLIAKFLSQSKTHSQIPLK